MLAKCHHFGEDYTDGQTHQLALYLLDWDGYGGGRSEQVQILNAATGQVLDTESVSNFSNGEYLIWNVSGNIQIKITNLNSNSSAVLDGLFLDSAGSASNGTVACTNRWPRSRRKSVQ